MTKEYTVNPNYFKQKNKYEKRATNSLMLGAVASCAMLGAVVFSPVIMPVYATTALAWASLGSFAVNKVIENNTDAYEPFSLREKFGNFLKNKIGAFRSNEPVVQLDQTNEKSKKFGM